MHTTSVLGIAKVFTTALLSLQAKSVLTPGQPVAAKRFSRDVRIRQVGLARALGSGSVRGPEPKRSPAIGAPLPGRPLGPAVLQEFQRPKWGNIAEVHS